MKRKVFSRFLLILTLWAVLVGLNTGLVNQVSASTNYKVIGYVTWGNLDTVWGDGKTLASEPSLKYLTNVVGPAVIWTSVTDPTLKGQYGPLSWLSYVVSAAHSKGLNVRPYLYGLTPDLAKLIANGKLSTLVTNIKNLVVSYNFDGIGLDIEAPNNPDQASMGKLIDSLYAQLNPIGKKISTVGMAGKYIPDITVSASAKVEYIDVMCYDMFGKYQNALYSDTVTVMKKWLGWGFPANKLILGTPFYGYNTSFFEYNYSTIVNTINPSASTDISTLSGKAVWWSGINTTKAKVDWAAQNHLGGIMALAIGYDKLNDSRSLLLNIYNEIGKYR